MEVNLSFIISTRNRLDFLKITLVKLIESLNSGEEIVVVDGNSNDGTKEYLEALYKAGKIHQFLSEADKNQAHGWNKAMMMAKGTLIKKIIDDDIFSYEAIRKCADYMLKNPETDLCISNSLTASFSPSLNISLNSRLVDFEKWKKGITKSFSFSDVYLLMRRSVLPKIGLYNTNFVMLDWEYSLRASYHQCEIAYYTGYMAMGVDTPQNITSAVSKQTLKNEGKIGRLLYEYPGDSKNISLYSKIKIAIGKTLFKIKTNDNSKDISSNYPDLYDILSQADQTANGIFL